MSDFHQRQCKDQGRQIILLEREVDALKSELARVKSAIHYPECWDTVGYPTLYDAVNEIGCNPCDCTRK